MKQDDAIGTGGPGSNLPEYSVGDISRAIKRVLESDFRRVRVRGEISGFKRAASGHLYFRLKDEDAVLDGVCWKGNAARLGLVPEDGLEVICTGRISSYAGRSSYQMVVEAMEVAGEGALLKLLEERRRKLAAEGLFDEDRKQALPYLPAVIGVISSPTGAVIRDILHRLRDRFPRHVLLWPVLVQGEAAAGQVAAAIEGFNALAPDGAVPRPDLLIVARGGGSLEDLWAFNEEVVVRAAAASTIPLISAIGHETDNSLIDYAADRRAPTPTAAAEMAVPVRTELLARLRELDQRLILGTERALAERRERVAGLARGLPDPSALLDTAIQRLDDRSERFGLGWSRLLQAHRAAVATLAARLRHPRDQIAGKQAALDSGARALASTMTSNLGRAERALERTDAGRRLRAAGERLLAERLTRVEHLGGLLASYSYQGVLARGFAVVRHGDRLITTAKAATPGLDVRLTFQDGDVGATIEDGGARPASPKPARRPAKSGPDDQGNLW